jgi:hypothetical protein
VNEPWRQAAAPTEHSNGRVEATAYSRSGKNRRPKKIFHRELVIMMRPRGASIPLLGSYGLGVRSEQLSPHYA